MRMSGRTAFIISAVVAGALSVSFSGAYAGELKSEHFVIHYETTPDFAKKVLKSAETEYDRITKNLSYTRFGNYWTFESRCVLRVYADKESYLRSRPGIPAWSAGYAEYATRTISGFRGSDKFLSTVLPHEITHLIFNDFVGSAAKVPKWFSEGVALSQEKNMRAQFVQLVGKAIHQHYFIPIYMLKDSAFEGIHTYQYTYLAYAEAGLLIDYLISRYGSEGFTGLCRRLKQGAGFEQAFQEEYRDQLDRVEGLEAEFIKKFSVDGAY